MMLLFMAHSSRPFQPHLGDTIFHNDHEHDTSLMHGLRLALVANNSSAFSRNLSRFDPSHDAAYYAQ